MSEQKLEEPVGIECRFATFCPPPKGGPDYDLHFVKEVVHYADGRAVPRLRPIKNFKRPFYITKKGLQNHQERKEWELVDNLIRYETTQSDLNFAVAKAMGQPWLRGSLKKLCESPYIYGVDISSTSIIKHEINSRSNIVTPYTLSVFDTETDMIHGHGRILMASLTFGSRVYTAVTEEFVAGYADPVKQILALCEKYLADEIASRKIEFNIEIVKDDLECVKRSVAKAHEWKPDWMAIWNIEFDVKKIEECCKRNNYSMAELFSDPSVPAPFKTFEATWGAAKKETASGRIINFKPSQRWHSFKTPASFTLIDAMQAYRQVRQGSAEEPSYSLDSILLKHKLKGKLKFKELENEEIPEDGAEWHRHMQRRFPLHYVVYNIFDCIGMEILDEKTKDLQMSLPMFAGCTDTANFNSLPKKTINELYWYAKDKVTPPRIMGSTAVEMSGELDEETTSVSGWIIMLPSQNVVDNGLKILKENRMVSTNVRIGVADLDVTGAYPHNELVMNVSKETTVLELVSIAGVDEFTCRMQTINFSAGPTNAVEFCTTMFGMPTLDQLLDAYDRQNLPQLEPADEPDHQPKEIFV